MWSASDKGALVVGAGISGMRAALDLADAGCRVTLIDKAAHMGGILSRLDHQFPTDGCGMCRMIPHVGGDREAARCLRKGLSHERIDIRLQTGLASVEGEAGDFRVVLRQRPNPVDPARCIGCGACVDACPVDMPDPFNWDTGTRKAIGLPAPHLAPAPYVIDIDACNQCGQCRKVCPTGAITMPLEDRGAFSILVVDDERIIRNSLYEWLSLEGGFTVRTASSGPQALETLKDHPVDLMLVDVKMPGMDGVTVLEQALSLHPELAVLMITAYATVDTAVSAMKSGALDYLVKPFDPEALVSRIVEIYRRQAGPPGPELQVGAIIVAGGAELYDPASGLNPFGYGEIPDVVTGPEFERLLSGTGPTGGELLRPSDGRPARKIAWIQCVGSRNLGEGADFCSSVCCMYALKQARLALSHAERKGFPLDAAIYCMDMRTFGKPYQAYSEQAEARGVRVERGRVHSIVSDPAAGALSLRVADTEGLVQTELFDLAVLSVGQRPSGETADLLELGRNRFGFIETEPFSMTRTSREGIFAAGSATGFKDIHDAVVCGGAAACNAAMLLDARGEGLSSATEPTSLPEESGAEVDIAVAVCECMGALPGVVDTGKLCGRLKADPAVGEVLMVDLLCSREGWESFSQTLNARRSNRVLVGACRLFRDRKGLEELAQSAALPRSFVESVDIRSLLFSGRGLGEGDTGEELLQNACRRLEMAAARLKGAEPLPEIAGPPVKRSALVVGGGIAGMSAALAIAEHGCEVDLVERSDHLGGNLALLCSTLEGNDPAFLLEQTVSRVTENPLIRLHLRSRVTRSEGKAGDFLTAIRTGQNAETHLHNGAILWATGAEAGKTGEYGYGTSPRVRTQQEFEAEMGSDAFNPERLKSVVMILCAGTRSPSANYCSRICCAIGLKQALFIKKRAPEAQIHVFYRDMMTYGFQESFYTRARREGVLFFPYTPDQKPRVSTEGERIRVSGRDPIVGREIEIHADTVILATGIAPVLTEETAAACGVSLDGNGFIAEAEYKWRPAETGTDGVFACGLAACPGNITESIASAQAAAISAVRLLARSRLSAAAGAARVRHSLCALCLQCISACPYGARDYDRDAGRILVHEALCRGCGACAAACPNSASYVEGFAPGQMLAVIDAAV
jgi:heterodisulfide reductase subunit A